MEFYLEGVHCAACVWLTEKLPELVDQVQLARLNLGTSIATVTITSKGSFAAVADQLQKMGYRVHPVKRGEKTDLLKKENRLLLIRLGTAGACAGNIMLLAVSLYGGASGLLAERFRWISFLLYLPVLLFSAVPFYRSAWSALTARTASIDIPVVFGILLGSAVSVINLATGHDEVYFDSLASLVFLLLSTRYLIRRIQQSAMQSSNLLSFLTPQRARRYSPVKGEFDSVPIDQIRPGDRLKILAGECIPVDGRVLMGTSSLNCALLSGESLPVRMTKGQIVFAGTMNLEAPLEIEVTQSGSKTRLGRILQSMEQILETRAPITLFTDRVSKIFVVAVLILSALTFLFLGFTQGGGSWHEGVSRALAIAIVTCPCTFALATPLVLSLTLGRLARAGIVVKGPDVLERLTQVDSVFLDKTGTLTRGIPTVMKWRFAQSAASEGTTDQVEIKAAVLALESQSAHPIARALCQSLRAEGITTQVPHVTDFRETLGKGVQGSVGGDQYQVGRSTEDSSRTKSAPRQGFEVLIQRNGKVVGEVRFGDELRPESAAALARLRTLGLELWILSGDHAASVRSVARALGICRKRCLSQMGPEEKNRVIRQHPRALMVGDGANDALALAGAHVSVAVHSGVEISLRAADIHLKTPGVQSIAALMVISRETLRVIRRNFAFSILYNGLAGAAALAGKIDPLFAAVLMPISALTVFLASMAGTRKMRSAFAELNS